MNDRFEPVLQELDFLVAESAQLAASGPQLRILHRLRQPGTDCCPGELVAMAALVLRSREFRLPLSPAPLLFFDFLARHRRLSQSAAQIEAALRNDPFVLRHAANARLPHRKTRCIARSTVKEYVKRIRRALAAAFHEARLNFDPCRVLLSEETEGNVVTYRLKANVTWIHQETISRFDGLSNATGGLIRS